MTHYDVLGIAPKASQPEVRRAYLRQARRHHPDRQVGADVDERAAAQRSMQQVNEAWLVLGDPGRRAEYDRDLDAPVWTPGAAHPDFVPFDDDDDPDDLEDLEDLEDLDDTPYGTRPVPRSHQLLPVASFVVGAALVLVGIAINLLPLAGLGGLLLLAAALGFVLTPVLAVQRAARDRRRASSGAP